MAVSFVVTGAMSAAGGCNWGSGVDGKTYHRLAAIYNYPILVTH